jgi:hypothetical protein
VHQECGDVYLISPEIVHSVWPTEEGSPVMPGNFSKLPDADYLADRTQHVLVKMRINAKVQELVAKIISLSPRVKAKDVVLHRVRILRKQWTWVQIEDGENVTSLDIFGPPGKNQDYIEVFHVQFKNNQSSEEPTVLDLPDPDRPVFAKLTEDELSQRKAWVEERCLIVEECDLDGRILPVLEHK